MSTENARVSTLKKGDDVAQSGAYAEGVTPPIGWPHFVVCDKPISGGGSVVVPVKLDTGKKDLITFPSASLVEVTRYMKPGAIVHAPSATPYRASETGCGKNGGVKTDNPDEITCTASGCQRVVRMWREGRLLAGEADVFIGGSYNSNAVDPSRVNESHAHLIVPFEDEPIMVTIAGLTYTSPRTEADLDKIEQQLRSAANAFGHAWDILAARTTHPEVTAPNAVEVQA